MTISQPNLRMPLGEEVTTAVLLAGGKSSRMGFEKALAEICGKKMIEWVIDALKGTINFVCLLYTSPSPRD